MAGMVFFRALCFTMLWSSSNSARARMDLLVSNQVFGEEVLAALASAPCPYAKSHEAKHFGIKYGSGESAFNSVQEQLNQLSETCELEEKTEQVIEDLQAEIAAGDVKIPALEGVHVDLEATMEAYKAANVDTQNVEACKAAASATSTGTTVVKSFGNAFEKMGWGLKGLFASDKDAHKNEYDSYASEQQKEEEALKAQKDLAARCAQLNEYQQAVNEKLADIMSVKNKRIADKTNLGLTQTALTKIQETVQTTAANIVTEITRIQQEMSNALKA